MARKKKHVVRVVLPDGINPITSEVRQLLEQLRYAGIVTIHRDNEDGVCFDLHCPSGLDDKQWAKMNAERMRSFTYNAVDAPGTAHLETRYLIRDPRVTGYAKKDPIEGWIFTSLLESATRFPTELEAKSTMVQHYGTCVGLRVEPITEDPSNV